MLLFFSNKLIEFWNLNKSPWEELVFNGDEFEQSNALQVEDKILEKVGKLILNKKEEYCDEQTKKEKNIPKQLENNLIKLEEAVDDNIQNELFRDSVSEASRNLTIYRNTVKGAYIAAENERISTYNAISTNKVKLAEFIWKDDYKFEAPGVYTDGYA